MIFAAHTNVRWAIATTHKSTAGLGYLPLNRRISLKSHDQLDVWIGAATPANTASSSMTMQPCAVTLKENADVAPGVAKAPDPA